MTSTILLDDLNHRRLHETLAGDTPDHNGALGHLRLGKAVGRRCVGAGQGDDRLRRGFHAVPPANVRVAAEGGALVRHQQLKWWMPTPPMIYRRFGPGLQKTGRERAYENNH